MEYEHADPEMPTGHAESRWVPLYLGWFPDVPAGYWAGNAIQACQQHEVVEGYPDGYYRPTATVTRDQMAVYVARAFDVDGAMAPTPE
jgi:hypothetical protein